jgi:hypothetical protein
VWVSCRGMTVSIIWIGKKNSPCTVPFPGHYDLVPAARERHLRAGVFAWRGLVRWWRRVHREHCPHVVERRRGRGAAWSVWYAIFLNFFFKKN